MNITVNLCSPPDRERLTASLMVANTEMIEVNQEGESLEVEIYPHPSGAPWILPLADLIEALSVAAGRLRGTS